MNSSNMSVPTLSLSSSRNKKRQIASIPTKQPSGIEANSYSRMAKINELEKDREVTFRNNLNGGNEVVEKRQRPPIFSKTLKNTEDQAVISRNVTSSSVQNLNKDVYLSINQETPAQQDSFQYSKITTQSRLLRNPQSTRVVESDFSRKTQNKKIDLNKALFQRKMTKLFQEAQFYVDELQLLGKDHLQNCIQELESLKFQSLESDLKIINRLSLLI